MFLTATLVLLPSGYVVHEIQPDQISVIFYIELAWFSASLSTVVAAIGAGVQDEKVIKESTYGYRQRYRERYRSPDE